MLVIQCGSQTLTALAPQGKTDNKLVREINECILISRNGFKREGTQCYGREAQRTAREALSWEITVKSRS